MPVELILPEPTPSQREVMDDPARYKVLQVGRRGGKTRLAFVVCCAGHGAKPNGRGMLDGGQICWMPSTVPQGRAVWREEVLPRFSGVPGFTINESERRVTAPNGGSLEIVSAEGCSAAQGRRFDGVFLDEPRDYDVEHIWKNIIRPTLIDRRGWAIFGSATRAGSGFNQLCKDVETGKRPGNWKKWHWRTQDNPALPKEEFEELKVEYPIEDVSGQQELLALLLDGIAGVAFPEFVPEVGKGIHVVPTRIPPRHWKYVACLDWGFVKGCYALAAVGPEGQVEFVYERILTREHAREAALASWRESSMWPTPQSISYDVAMDYDAGLKQGTTLTDEWLGGMLLANGNRLEGLPAMIPAKHTPGSRPARKNLFHKMLKYSEARNPAGFLEPWALPRLRFQQQCKYLIESMKSIPLDPRNPEDVDCFVAGTMVETSTGPKPIETVQVGEYAMTPVGWRQVTESFVSGLSPTTIVTLANGTVIEGTPNHKVFVEGRGLVELQNLSPGFTLTEKTSKFAVWKNVSSSIVASDSLAGLENSTTPEGHDRDTHQKPCIDKYGWTPMAPSLAACRSTTATMTPTTTTSPTSYSWTADNTPDTTCCSVAPMAVSRNSWRGNAPPQGKPSCEKTLEKCLIEHPNDDLRADIVASLLSQNAQSSAIARRSAPRLRYLPPPQKHAKSAGRSSRGGTVKSSRRGLVVTSVVGSSERKPVYNLTVEQAHLFYANGILVTNTKSDDHGIDSAGYLLVTLQDLARPLDIPAPKPDQHPGMSKDGRKREVPVWERAMRDVESPNKYWTPP